MAEELIHNDNFTSGESEILKHKERQYIFALVSFTIVVIAMTSTSLRPNTITHSPVDTKASPVKQSSSVQKETSPQVLGAKTSKKEASTSATTTPVTKSPPADLSVKNAGSSAQTSSTSPTLERANTVIVIIPTPQALPTSQTPSLSPAPTPTVSGVPQITPSGLVNGLLQNVNGVVGGLLNTTH